MATYYEDYVGGRKYSGDEIGRGDIGSTPVRDLLSELTKKLGGPRANQVIQRYGNIPLNDLLDCGEDDVEQAAFQIMRGK